MKLTAVFLLFVVLTISAAQAVPFQLTLVDRAGKKEVIGTLPPTALALRLSPDGKQVVFDTFDDGAIWIQTLADRATKRVVAGPGNQFPMWSGDGDRVLFISSREGEPSIFSQRADGTGAAERMTATARAPESWSTVNQMLSYITLTDGDYDIWGYSLRERKSALLFKIPGSSQNSSTFSPDGRWVAYMSDEGGKEEVWVQPFPSTGAKFKVTRDGGTRPVWAPDGKELYFDNGKQLFVVSVRTQPGFSTGDPTPLPITGFVQTARRRQYDLTPDGKKFLMLYF